MFFLCVSQHLTQIVGRVKIIAGFGIRKQLPSWETGYIARNGPGVRMTFKDSASGKDLAVTFSCKDPNKVVDLLTGSSG